MIKYTVKYLRTGLIFETCQYNETDLRFHFPKEHYEVIKEDPNTKSVFFFREKKK